MNARWNYLAGFVLALTLLAGCGKKDDAKKEDPKADAKKEDAPAAEGEAAAPPVQVAAATRESIRQLVVADAVLFPLNQANVMPKLSSPMKRVLVNRGDHVKAGQLIAELEARDLEAAVRETKGQYDQAQAAYRLVSGATVPEDRTRAQSDTNTARQGLEAAQRLYDNRVSLQKEGALAQKLVDDAKVALVQAQSLVDTASRRLQSVQSVSEKQAILSAQAQVAAAKAHYENAQAQASYAEVRSPINGVVSDRSVYPGEMSASGAPLMSIIDISQVVARANIPVTEAASIKVGRPATISGPGGEVTGRVTVVSPSVDAAATTIQVWVQAANKGESMKPGGSVRVSITSETVKNAVVVPKGALLNHDEGGEKVLVVGADSKVRERKVEVGIREGGKVQILKGVAVGESVVISGGLGVEDKAKVAVQKAEGTEPQGKESEDKKDTKK